jgi:hypothetical protein
MNRQIIPVVIAIAISCLSGCEAARSVAEIAPGF